MTARKMWQPSWACPTDGYFYPPTLFTGVSPSATIAQVEIFGPVLVSMTFRTPSEAVALANNTPYGLAASVWTENINLALDIAPKIKAGVVWVNSSNLFDAAVGFGGYREVGFRARGRARGDVRVPARAGDPACGVARATNASRCRAPARRDVGRRCRAHRSHAQALHRREAGASRCRRLAARRERRPATLLGEVAEGNRKDIRNAVEAAHAAFGVGRARAGTRARRCSTTSPRISPRARASSRRASRR